MTDTQKTIRREVTLPAATFLDLLGAVRGLNADALRERGRSTGNTFAERLLSTHDDAASARALPASVFWKRINDLFVARGWGSLAHASGAPGTGELRSSDWIEAERDPGAATCEFTAGVIEGLLRTVSGREIHVHEAECRAAGATACRFQFGSRAALEAMTATANATVAV